MLSDLPSVTCLYMTGPDFSVIPKPLHEIISYPLKHANNVEEAGTLCGHCLGVFLQIEERTFS